VRFVSLFAGIGGLDLGLERAGWECVAQVEIEPFARRVLAKHWPAVPRFTDVREIGGSDLPACDAIVGGFPCQDISVAGRGDGLSGERSGLWFEFLRLVQEVRPRWVLAENVPALRTRGIDTVLGGLEQEGYACWPVVVGARHVGAPHRRDRVFIVARLDHPSSEGRAAARHAINAATPGAGTLLDAAGSGPRLADADDGRGWQDRQPAELRTGGAVEPPGHRRDTAARSSHQEPQRRVSMADADRAGLRAERSRWPSRPGEPQHQWEKPRTTEPPLGGAVDGLPAGVVRRESRLRRASLKAYGNAVVPQVAEVIGRAIGALA